MRCLGVVSFLRFIAASLAASCTSAASRVSRSRSNRRRVSANPLASSRRSVMASPISRITSSLCSRIRDASIRFARFATELVPPAFALVPLPDPLVSLPPRPPN